MAAPSSTSKDSPKSRLNALRARMTEKGIDAYLVPSTDPHQSEYLPECWNRRAWISGFTGSAGDVVVTRSGGGLWTDGRYFLQASKELKGSGLKLQKSGLKNTPTQSAYLKDAFPKGGRIGFDPKTLSLRSQQGIVQALKDSELKLVPIETNLVDQVWADQPALPTEAISPLANRYAGKTVAAKLKEVRHAMKEAKTDALVVTMLDSIAWLFNIRGRDVDFNPVTIGYALVTLDDATLFIDPAKKTPALQRHLKGVAIEAYKDFGKALGALNQKDTTLWLDPSSASAWVASKLKRARHHLALSPIKLAKSKKNKVEIEGIRAAHVRDGVAVSRFLHWLEESVPKGGVTELTAAERLAAFRAEGEYFQGPSFDTISGYREHGAIIHYRVDTRSDKKLEAKGIYLVDSGGQYLDGTTDITRTVLLGGQATKEQKDRFTRVLKGHIALARMSFPEGVTGNRLDTLARMHLWEVGLDYGHGTGHGVGAYLNVHEGPCGIHHRAAAPVEEGNVLSNEPGYYKEGEYGIRIENLVLVRKRPELSFDKPFLGFDTLTLCPIDLRLVEPNLLEEAEKAWLNDYHKRVATILGAQMQGPAKRWLKRATRAI